MSVGLFITLESRPRVSTADDSPTYQGQKPFASAFRTGYRGHLSFYDTDIIHIICVVYLADGTGGFEPFDLDPEKATTIPEPS